MPQPPPLRSSPPSCPAPAPAPSVSPAPARRFSFLSRWGLSILIAIGFGLSLLFPAVKWPNNYIQLVIMYAGINIILTASLNLVNGYMGEFSVGHAGFMSVGAYASSMLTIRLFPESWWAFPAAVFAGGAAAGIMGVIVAVPSFRTRGDYLAIVTLAFNMIIKSAIENIDSMGGPRGMLGMSRLTSLPWTFAWVVFSLWIMRNFIYSKYGRGVLAIREDEIAAGLMTVSTRRTKLMVFCLSSFFAGVAGGLYAHLIQFINPRSFDLLKSTDILLMVYLGGIGSLGGSILGASLYTVLLEVLRPFEQWRMVVMPLALVLLMIFRPRGIMGLKEFPWFVPLRDRKRKEGALTPARK